MIYGRHHRYELRQALKAVELRPFNLKSHLEDWIKLYSLLVVNKKITGMCAFPRSYHEKLAEITKITAIGAWHANELISCHLWTQHKEHVMSHLAASNEQGYTHRAAYAINDFALDYFHDAAVINFGGGAGHIDNENDGLVRFKRGFTNDTALSYLCGAVLDKKRYDQLAEAKKLSQSSFFPAYRTP